MEKNLPGTREWVRRRNKIANLEEGHEILLSVEKKGGEFLDIFSCLKV